LCCPEPALSNLQLFGIFPPPDNHLDGTLSKGRVLGSGSPLSFVKWPPIAASGQEVFHLPNWKTPTGMIIPSSLRIPTHPLLFSMLEAGKTTQQEIMRIQIAKMQNPFFTMLSACGMCYEVSYLGDGSDILGLWGRIFILDFAYISRKFPFDPRLFSWKEEISTPPPCGLLIGIYIFYESWSTDTFRKSQRSGMSVPPAV
jgi:hypothetical protein